MEKKSLFSRLSNVGKILNRAAFSDVDQKITKYHYGSDAFMRILQSRYSCHSFNSYPVSDSKLNMILAKLRTVHPCYGAPVVLIVGCRNEEAWIRESDGVNAAKTDAAIVLTHLMLTATDAGLANMWIWDFDPRKVREALPETREHGVYALLAIGYPAAKEGKPTELHTERKPLEAIVRTL